MVILYVYILDLIFIIVIYVNELFDFFFMYFFLFFYSVIYINDEYKYIYIKEGIKPVFCLNNIFNTLLNYIES